MSKIPQIKEYEGYPVVTAEKMKYLDTKATSEYGILQISLMENAGREVAKETLKVCIPEITKSPLDIKIVVCSGRGNNGGDGLVAARYLKESGAEVEVFMIPPKDTGYGELVVQNLQKAKEKQIKITLINNENLQEGQKSFQNASIIIDALLGVGAVGKPTGIIKKVIQLMNKSLKPVMAVDIPSGISPDTGHHSGVFITAKWTLTLGFPKTGLLASHALKNVGKLKIIDIGYPKQLIEEARQD
jgi:NAD(P)H-hydrate epimerase